MTTRDPSGTRDRILDALETLLLTKGLAQVTLDSVAATAGVSKGGLLYHFKSKDALLAGLLRRVGARADRQLKTAAGQGKSVAEWYLQAPRPDDDADAVELALYRSMLAAMRTVEATQESGPGETDRALIDVFDGYRAAIDDEIPDPVHAEIVRLVGDGVYLRALLGMPPIEPALYRQIITRLLGADTPRG